LRRVDPDLHHEWPDETLGNAPLERRSLPMGSYLLRVRADGYAEALWPLLIERNEEEMLEIPLLPEKAVPPGMVYVPGGTVHVGDRLLNYFSKQRVGPFFIDREEVSFGEYWRFLRSLTTAEQNDRFPRTDRGALSALPLPLERKPVVGIRVEDAEAYAAWVGGRLPKREEWEFAARGADGRDFPWGNKFVPGYANTRDRWAGKQEHLTWDQFEDVDSPKGLSPFGLSHMSGNAGELVRVGNEWYIFGGNVTFSSVYCRIGVVFNYGGRSPIVGFRCVRDVAK